MSKQTHKLIFSSKRQLALYFVTLISLAVPVFTGYMIFSDLDKFLLEFSSKLSGYCWMVTMILASNVMLGAVLWLNGRYVLKIESFFEEYVTIKTWSILGNHRTRIYAITILDGLKFMPGRSFLPARPVSNSPWFKLKTPKGQTLVVDLQGEFHDKISKLGI